MKVSFSTLACPDWTMQQIVAIAARERYDGIELRFVQGEDSFWKLPAFSGSGVASTKRELEDCALTISCLDTSCRFHSPDAAERERWIEEGNRMADLAAELGAPGLRIFGDTIQAGADRDSTQGWIAECMQRLAESAAEKHVGVWIENHGDFASAKQTAAILRGVASPGCGVVWDPANSFAAHQESPGEGGAILQSAIRHVHVKDLRHERDTWKYVATGEGVSPLNELKAALESLNYDRFISFEWEKKWHPELADAEVALPHFARWFRENYA
jgi:sugar phosphate isomerase/epimerase